MADLPWAELQRGAAIPHVVALSAGYSLLSDDRLALDRLAAETRASDPEIAFLAIRDTYDIVLAFLITTLVKQL